MQKKTVQAKSKKIFDMDKESLLTPLPIVYTTKLDEMKIFNKDLSNIRPKDIIESITSESKPLRRSVGPIDNTKMCKRVYDIDKHANGSPIINSRYEKLQSILKKIKMKSNNPDTCSHNKVESRQAMCKPLKIVPKPEVKDEMEVFNISSDSDDDVITIKEQNLDIPDSNKKSTTSTSINTICPVTNHTIKDVSDLQKVLLAKDLQDCCVIIYNLYTKELEAYQIGKSYNVIGHKTRKYTEVCRFPLKKCKFMINIVACCWKKRQSFMSLLLLWKKYIDIARFLSSTHPCKQNCTCCCDCFGQCSDETQGDNEGINSDTNINDSLINSPVSFKEKSKLITTALTYEPKKKLKWRHDDTSSLNDKNKSNKYCKRLLKFNNTPGKVELYELGPENIVYSKVISSTDDESSWLFKTVNRSRYFTNFTFTDPAECEKKNNTYKRMNNILSFHTKCFLRNPMKLETKKKYTNYPGGIHAMRYKIEHTKSLTSSKGSEVLSILPKAQKTNYHAPPVYRPLEKSSPARSHSRPKTPILPAVMDQEVSQNINVLIEEILHRFRDVFLTINSEGRVSAALNAPLTSLSPSEVNILSQILDRAQSQVDKLGLTPGTYLTPSVMQSTGENSTSSTNATNSEPRDNSKNEENANESTENNFLNNSSSLIARKKHLYKQSFCNYLGVILDAVPKITNVFSVNRAKSTSSDIMKSPLKGRNLMIEINNGSIINNAYAKKPDVPMTLDGTQTIRPNKRKTCEEYKGKVPKIRVKSAAEMIVENSPPVKISHTSRVVKCNPTPTPRFIADHNYVFKKT